MSLATLLARRAACTGTNTPCTAGSRPHFAPLPSLPTRLVLAAPLPPAAFALPRLTCACRGRSKMPKRKSRAECDAHKDRCKRLYDQIGHLNQNGLQNFVQMHHLMVNTNQLDSGYVGVNVHKLFEDRGDNSYLVAGKI